MSPAQSLFDSDFFQAERGGFVDHPELPEELPDESVDFLLQATEELGARRVFEFGSGRSTEAFLKQGLSVASLGNSESEMRETLGQIDPEALTTGRHTAFIQPLELTWRRGVPYRDWKLTPEIADELNCADLILIDSPHHVPFRLSTLCTVLSQPTEALVVLDDTRIRTLARNCDRFAQRNTGRLWHRRVCIGHGFDCFARRDRDVARPLIFPFSVLEILKGWRRFFMASKLL